MGSGVSWTITGEPVWVLPRQNGTPDAHGNPVYTWPAHTGGTAVKIDGAAVSPRSANGSPLSAETNETNRDAVIVGLMVFLPPGSRMTAVDRMYVRGDTYEVVGEPGIWVNPWQQSEEGVQVALERVEG